MISCSILKHIRRIRSIAWFVVVIDWRRFLTSLWVTDRKWIHLLRFSLWTETITSPCLLWAISVPPVQPREYTRMILWRIWRFPFTGNHLPCISFRTRSRNCHWNFTTLLLILFRRRIQWRSLCTLGWTSTRNAQSPSFSLLHSPFSTFFRTRTANLKNGILRSFSLRHRAWSIS